MPKHLDDQWYGSLHKITEPLRETFSLLEPEASSRDIKRQSFEASGYRAAISLIPDAAVLAPLKEPYQQLAQLREAIAHQEPHQLVRQTYLAYIDDILNSIDLVRAAVEQDMAAYVELNDALYGRPDNTMYHDVCDWLKYDVTTTLAHTDNSALIESGQQVLECLPSVTGSYRQLLPSETTFSQVRQVHYEPKGFFETLFGEMGLPNEPYISQVEGDIICRQVLDNIGADYKIVDSDNHIWSVSRQPRRLYRPVGYRLARDEFVGIVAYEIGSHIYESVNGAKQPLRLLEMGLAGYVLGNEGRALLREQIVYKDITMALAQPAWEYCLMQHLAISLALGYHKNRRYNFPEIYDVLYRLYLFFRSRRNPYDTNNQTFAREEAWLLTVRLLKGTDGTGGSYQKDLVYLEGNVKTWRLAAQEPEIVLHGDQGKFNLLDSRHRAMLAELNQSSN